MRKIHILNPAAGQGEALRFKPIDEVYVTQYKGDAERFVTEILQSTDEEVDFYIYGGDGTVNEAVNGIVSRGGNRARICIKPTGTGNDLVRTVAQSGKSEISSDVLTVNDRYAVNAVNTGFDLEVVLKAAELKKKPFVSGSLAYILGIFEVLSGKMGKRVKITYTDRGGNENIFNDDCLLALAGNGMYYGGGFKSSPAASLTDGFIDLLIVKKMTRRKFISLVAEYKKGMHINTEKLEPVQKFADVITYAKCKKVIIEGITDICTDGEVFKADRVEIGILPGAIKIIGENV